jgi:hypothetical protein
MLIADWSKLLIGFPLIGNAPALKGGAEISPCWL